MFWIPSAHERYWLGFGINELNGEEPGAMQTTAPRLDIFWRNDQLTKIAAIIYEEIFPFVP
jgi:hypothetical protein